MWGWAKAAAVLAVSVLLMGSKIIIRVPEGGEVVSSSGLYACSAGEVCTIEINEQHFAESFTAVPAPGYAFASWGGQPGAVCRDSRDPHCADLDGGPFADFAVEAASLRKGAVLTLSPAFTAREDVATASSPRFRITSLHTTRYYPVSGRTQEEVWAQLLGAANPIAIDRAAGIKPVGHASFEYRYSYRSKFAANPANCRVDSGSIEFRFDTVLPELAASETIRDQLQQRWAPFQARITEHEAGHHAIYRELVTELPQVLAQVGEAPCAELDRRVSLAVADAVGAIKQASAEYDENYSSDSYVASSM